MGTVPSRSAFHENVLEKMSCNSCSVRFTLLKRKKMCAECNNQFCSHCAPKIQAASGRRCDRCQFLVSGNFDRYDLKQYKAKELRNFMAKRKIPMDGCKEKHDFIDVLMEYTNNTHYQREKRDERQRRERMEDRARLRDEPMQPANPQQPQPPSYQAVVLEDLHRGTALNQDLTNSPPNVDDDDADEELIVVDDSDPLPMEVEASSNEPNTPSSQHSRVPPTNRDHASQPTASAFESEKPECSTPPPSQRLQLSDLQSTDDVERLNTRQLKELLQRNYVDYKGCVEKHELVTRVTRLWHDHHRNVEAAAKLDAGEDSHGDDLCKVCMDAVVDCVLLDCGHMLTCTKCGKQLAECPVCRQYIVRVVHVFKS